jgi:5-(aminomethyl)-3-furanmethanol phosphate kinase
MTVVKIGGGLTAIPGALDTVCRAVADAGRSAAIVVVPGGGPFADAVRAFERDHGISADASHWMAMLAMDQYAEVLAERIAGAVLVDEAGAVADAVDPHGVAVLAPYRWMRAADVLPHTWDATSDSVAAFVAGALDAERLVLVKPTGGGEELVDRCFRSVLPVGLSWRVVAWESIGALTP